MTCDRDYMMEAIVLARRAAGRTSPNPMVGCVLVRDGAIVGRGWHEGAGHRHAEVAALEDAGPNASGSTAYVTLEPCNHQGRTGPCTAALIAAGVKEVVFAVSDPNPVAAGGSGALLAAGLVVRRGVCSEEAAELIRPWLFSLKNSRPYVIGKAAVSFDGRISTASGESRWITSPDSREAAHRLRASVDAIVVGAGTVRSDDPALTARLVDRTHSPLRVVLDSRGTISPGAKVFERSARAPILATTEAASSRLKAFTQMGVDPLVLPATPSGRPCLHALLETLHARGIVTLMVEGGGAVLGSFFDADLLEELHFYMAPIIIGGGRSVFSGQGVPHLADATRFLFDPPIPIGRDMFFKAVRKDRR